MGPAAVRGILPQPPGHERVVVIEWGSRRALIRCNCGLDTGPGLRPRDEAEEIYDAHLVELGFQRPASDEERTA